MLAAGAGIKKSKGGASSSRKRLRRRRRRLRRSGPLGPRPRGRRWWRCSSFPQPDQQSWGRGSGLCQNPCRGAAGGGRRAGGQGGQGSREGRGQVRAALLSRQGSQKESTNISLLISIATRRRKIILAAGSRQQAAAPRRRARTGTGLGCRRPRLPARSRRRPRTRP